MREGWRPARPQSFPPWGRPPRHCCRRDRAQKRRSSWGDTRATRAASRAPRRLRPRPHRRMPHRGSGPLHVACSLEFSVTFGVTCTTDVHLTPKVIENTKSRGPMAWWPQPGPPAGWTEGRPAGPVARQRSRAARPSRVSNACNCRSSPGLYCRSRPSWSMRSMAPRVAVRRPVSPAPTRRSR